MLAGHRQRSVYAHANFHEWVGDLRATLQSMMRACTTLILYITAACDALSVSLENFDAYRRVRAVTSRREARTACTYGCGKCRSKFRSVVQTPAFHSAAFLASGANEVTSDQAIACTTYVLLMIGGCALRAINKVYCVTGI